MTGRGCHSTVSAPWPPPCSTSGATTATGSNASCGHGSAVYDHRRQRPGNRLEQQLPDVRKLHCLSGRQLSGHMARSLQIGVGQQQDERQGRQRPGARSLERQPELRIRFLTFRDATRSSNRQRGAHKAPLFVWILRIPTAHVGAYIKKEPRIP